MPPAYRRKSAPGSRRTEKPAPTGTDGSSTTVRTSVLEMELVNNLKRQVAYLEAEATQLKEKLKAANELINESNTKIPKDVTKNENSDNAVVIPEERGTDKVNSAVLPEPNISHTPHGAREDGGNHMFHSYTPAYLAGLQFVVDRLRDELVVSAETLCSERRAKENAIEENAVLRLRIQELNFRLEESEKLHHDALNTLNVEQNRRRELEDRLRAGGLPVGGGDVCSTLEDIVAEKDYYRIQTDRLRVAQREGLTRIQVLEERLKEGRLHAVGMELALRSSSQELEAIQALNERKAAMYERLDKSCTFALKQMREAAETCEKVQHMLFFRSAEAASTDSSVFRFISCELEKISSALNASSAFVRDDMDTKGMASDEAPRCTVAPTAAVPQPPKAAVPQPPMAAVPQPPTAAVPQPPTAAVPQPPMAAVPQPPAVAVPVASSVGAVPSSTVNIPEGLSVAINEELEAVSRKISEAEAVLLSYLDN
ncbi:Cornifin (SPRR) family, putative [Trypanosoma equiperdum]|uniref:Cornifin (SPRR) family, putative n=1 Tax=Trypanosoma equiperdum TaxID=5694 RepID=A0A1G4IFM5_TRYEQ|nr:Cornifin (SPRR) family, putative [Trypanosoma equiperdum]